MPDEHNATALIVDDNFYNRDLCMIALTHVGYKVTEAENGEEALKLLEANSFDLLILDLSMPVLSGVEVIRRLRAKDTHQRMSILVMTANPHMVTNEVELHADFVMNKPMNIQEFAQLAQRLANRSHGAPQATKPADGSAGQGDVKQ